MLTEIMREIYKLYIEMSPYLLLGLTFAGVLHFLLDSDKIAKHIGGSNFLSVLKSTVLGFPFLYVHVVLYNCNTSSQTKNLKGSNSFFFDIYPTNLN